MNTFPDHTKFKYSWRKYQQVVLDQLDTFLTKDNHLHVVAPPGSGKTVLGLEAMIRLNRPTLILSPTLVIRDQWINRLCELFLNTNDVPNWISTDIRNPKFLTIVTYQGLHTACNTNDGLTDIIRKLKAQSVQTFVLDEAHHLKNQWWDTLHVVKKAIAPTIIGLTATPPYDSSYNEWQRYLLMNGEIDIEITIPELIKERDLCPHQDLVYISHPTLDEFKHITKYRHNITELFNELSASQVLINSFLDSEIWINPESHLEWIYDNLNIYTSYLILLLHNNFEIPERHFEILGLDAKKDHQQNPKLLYERLEVILNYFLFQDKVYFTDREVEKEEIINKLKRRGAVEKNVVRLRDNSTVNRMLTVSNSKLKSIVEIAHFEHSLLSNKLRMVILTDFIREEYLVSPEKNLPAILKMGIVPIFNALVESCLSTDKLGVLTGTLIILPKSSLAKFKSLSKNRNILFDDISYKQYEEKFIIVKNTSAIKNDIVDIVTQLFTDGEIEILIGTKSLLGEGWDAPAINSLVLASFVGSFVSSNQMRGRAIRAQRNNSDKTSNIWHLACVDATAADGGEDLNVLSRRFKSFIGISNTDKPYIENGLDRLSLKRDWYSEDDIISMNKLTFETARNRDILKDKWDEAIKLGVNIVDEIKIPYPREEPSRSKMMNMYFNKTIMYAVAEATALLSAFGYFVIESFFDNLRFIKSLKDIIYYLASACVIGIIVFGWKLFKTFKLYVRYRDISKDFDNIGKALLVSLIEQGAIKSPEYEVSVESEIFEDGTVACCLQGASRGEQAIFINAFMEVLNTIDNPRYIIVRKGNVWKIMRNDYHSVPNLLGTNKVLANFFHERWMELVGRSELIYTRTIEGRKRLLKARVNSLSAKLDDDQQPQEYRKWL